MSTCQRLLTFEALSLATKNGLEAETAVNVLLASGGRNSFLEKLMAPQILKGNLVSNFTLGLAHKDVRLACQLGMDTGVPMFLGNTTRELYQLSISEMGRDAQVDTASLVFDKLADSNVVPAEHVM